MMGIIINFFMFLPLIFILWVKKLATKISSKKNGSLTLPPGPWPLPIIGNLLQISTFPHVSFHLLSKKYGPIFYLKLGQITAVVISSAEIASDIFKNQDTIFCNRPISMATRRLSYGAIDIGFCPYGERWRQLRRFYNTVLLSSSKVDSFQGIREEEVRILVNIIRESSLKGKVINLRDMTHCLLNNIIYRILFGKRISLEGECWSTPRHELFKEIFEVFVGVSVGDIMPCMRWLSFLSGWKSRVDETFKQIDRLLEEEIKERVKGVKGYENGHDLLDTLLRCEAEKDSSFGCLLTRKDVKDMIIGATETSAVSIEWVMTELMRNPNILKKAQAEVRQAVSDNGVLRESDIKNMHYLEQVIKETFRLHPPGTTLIPRESIKDTKVFGYDIPAKTRILVNIWSIGRDSRYWKDVESFCPERFEKSSINFKGNNFEFIPFGSGRRSCLGIELAIASVELVLANLLYSFNWELPKGMTIEDVDVMENMGIATRKMTPLNVVANPLIQTT